MFLWPVGRSDDELIEEAYKALDRNKRLAAKRLANTLCRRKHPKGFELAAGVERSRDRLDKALKIAEAGTVRHPESDSLWALLGDLHTENRSFEAAARAYEECRKAGAEAVACDLRYASLLREFRRVEEAQEFLETLEIPATSAHYWSFVEILSSIANYEKRYEDTLALLPPPLPPEGVSRRLRARILNNESFARIVGRNDIEGALAKAREAYGLDRTDEFVLMGLNQVFAGTSSRVRSMSLKVKLAASGEEPGDLRTFNIWMFADDVDHAMTLLRELEPESTRSEMKLLKYRCNNSASEGEVGIVEVKPTRRPLWILRTGMGEAPFGMPCRPAVSSADFMD